MVLKEVAYNGTPLWYYTTGIGTPIVLLHGFAEDATIWHNQYDIFPGHKLIIPQLAGSGGSQMIDDMSIEGLAESIKYIIDAESTCSSSKNDDHDGVIIIGHSMGGYIALALAEKYPAILNGIGLFHSTAYADSDAKKETRRKGIQSIGNYGADAFLSTAIPNLYSDNTKRTKPGLVDEQMHTLHNFSSPVLVSYYEAMMRRKDRTDILRKSEVPVLFVIGRDDNAVPIEDGLKQCHLPQISYIHILEKSGHMGMIEEEKNTNKILAGFITIIDNRIHT